MSEEVANAPLYPYLHFKTLALRCVYACVCMCMCVLCVVCMRVCICALLRVCVRLHECVYMCVRV